MDGSLWQQDPGRREAPLWQLRKSLTQPDFEQAGHGHLRLWLRRWQWRRRCAKLAREPEEVLADLGTDRCELLAYAARPFWRR